jgi:hypothetical protein
MGKAGLTRESQYVVGEEKVLNYILATLCLAIFLYGIIDAVRRHFIKIDYQSFVFALALAPAWLFFRKARSNKVYIRINKTGIYHHERFVTGWSKLHKAYISQKEKKSIFNIQDNFLLVLEYRKDNGKEGIRRKIPLTNTQNRSEEEIMEAVKFFWTDYKSHTGV